MPGSTYDQPNFLMAAAASVKKRKREIEADEDENAPIHTSFVPSSLQHLNSPFHYECEYTNHATLGPRHIPPHGASETVPYRSRPYSQPSFSKKRRQQQQTQQYPWAGTRQSPGQKQHIPTNAEDMRSKTVPMPHTLPIPLSSNNPPASTSPSSPAISPKTTIPQYPTQPLQSYPGGQQQPQQTAERSLPMPPFLLRPCHICHRRPNTRAVLDAYADCELCGERTCYICLRECNGPDCSRYAAEYASGGAQASRSTSNFYGEQSLYDDQRRRKVCSWCAVEGLTETGREVVRCLDCMRKDSASVPMPTSLPRPSSFPNLGSGGGHGSQRGEDPVAMSVNGGGHNIGNGNGYGPGPWNFRPS